VDPGLLDRLENVVSNDFAHVTYTEAVNLLSKHNHKFDYKVSWGCDLQTEHERYLTEQVFKRPVFVTDYPKGDLKALLYEAERGWERPWRRYDCLVPGNWVRLSEEVRGKTIMKSFWQGSNETGTEGRGLQVLS